MIFCLLGILIPTAFTLGVDENTTRRINDAINKHKVEIIKIRRFLHMNPELGNREYETSKLIASKLMFLGLEVKKDIAKTGVVGILQGDQPGITIAVRADMDALPIQEKTNLPYQSLNPGVMHACGHDIHSAIVLGSAYVLNSLKDIIRGNIKFIFQPAEEGAPPGEEGGADLMIEEGVLEDPPVHAIFGLHVWPENLGDVFFSPGAIMANSDKFQVTIKGKSAHGARPHEGIDAISLAAQAIIGIQSIPNRYLDATDPSIITIGKIQGGSRSNIIAEEVWFEGTVRTLSRENQEKITEMIDEVVRGITKAFGADYSFSYQKGTPMVYNHPELAKIMMPTLAKVVGADKVKSLTPQMVAEDFSYFAEKIPGFFFFLGVRNPSRRSMAPLHNPYFNPDERSIELGIKIMSHLLLYCLDHQQQIRSQSH
jgi:amidohydrolase